ncbi:zinc finger protein 19-like isoform X2 [Maniola jurtina]|uniref:zinc finger protein 19-like isoform X2 n=1 Tax=Maniola jurtina TaxID=191418 RepID=UPI001E68BFA0|nr:zinc finger protein 19-like isoform X2 [Maniola jurtina]
MNFSESDSGQNYRNNENGSCLLFNNLQEHQELVDFTNVCRICASTADQSCPVFDELGQCNDLAGKINKYLPIKVSQEDGLPQVICEQCRSTLLAWDELVQCCIQANVVLQQKLLDPDKTKQEERAGFTESPIQTGTPRRVSFEAFLLDQEENDDLSDHKSNTESDWQNTHAEIVSDDDDRPLAAIAKSKSNLYQDFYDALVNFRNHFVTEHDSQIVCSDFSDSSDSEDAKERDSEKVNLNSFDDLTDCNMRKDKMDEQTRTELSQVQTKINGKVYYTCKICGKHLSSTHTYIFHKRIHTGERPCVCHICGKQFRAPNGLKRHVTETHEKQRWYTCIVCFKNFANSQNLKQHMRIHTGERPFVCPHCGKRFTQSGSLHVHLKTHSDHYPHHCAECGAKFRLRSGLTRHRLKHTGQRPHVCVHCGKGFRQKHELNSHILAHTDSKPHACTFCGTAFRQRRALRHHCKRLHQNEVSDATQIPNVYNHVGQYEG